LTLDVKKSNSSNETPNVMTVGVEKYGLNHFEMVGQNKKNTLNCEMGWKKIGLRLVRIEPTLDRKLLDVALHQ
jgi:hypothetical protein